jgi:hypothetical protein
MHGASLLVASSHAGEVKTAHCTSAAREANMPATLELFV